VVGRGFIGYLRLGIQIYRQFRYSRVVLGLDESSMKQESQTVSFTAMKDGTEEDYKLLQSLEEPYLSLTADRVMSELRRHGESTLEGYRITRLEHALQSATRAERDGADIDWVVGALLRKSHGWWNITVSFK